MPLLTDIKPAGDSKTTEGADGAKGGTETKDTKSTEGAKGGDDAAKVKADADKKAADDLEAAGKLPLTKAEQLKLADGFKFDPAFLPLAGKLNLTAAQAQALVDYQAAAGKSAAEARATAAEQAATAAIDALKADKDIGGPKFKDSMAIAQKALVKFGGPINKETGRGELVDALDKVELADGSMLGDSAVFAKFLVNVGKTLSEDSVSGNLGGGAEKTEANDEATFLGGLYKNSKKTALKFPGS